MTILKILTGISVVINLSAFGQGVNFDKKLSWQQIRDKAKRENKFIFIDCYATWCGPCKWMDKEVYTNDSLGNFCNSNLLCVKVQFDTSTRDDANIREWYVDANWIRNEYKIAAFPTFLFFSPEGSLVHRDVGAKNVENFYKLVSDALNPKKQYYTLLKDYKGGVLDQKDLPSLAWSAARLGDRSVANEVAQDYTERILSRLPEEELLTNENIRFLSSFTESTRDTSFRILFNCLDKFRSRNQFTYFIARSNVEACITREEIDRFLFSNDKFNEHAKPNWRQIERSIEKKFGKYYADKLVLDGKARYSAGFKNLPNYFKYRSILLKRYRSDMSNDQLNTFCWEICQLSNDTKSVAIAAEAMSDVVTTEKDSANLLPASVDTYANLLYRLGKVNEAISQEKLALFYAENYEKGRMVEEQRVTLARMEKGEKIWPVKPD
jgi:thiol-disulfide isomerase/thioredoxin